MLVSTGVILDEKFAIIKLINLMQADVLLSSAIEVKLYTINQLFLNNQLYLNNVYVV